MEFCWTLWSRSKEEARTKELEDQNLYRYRSKTHLIAESESDALEKQFKNVFPSYTEFMDEEYIEEEVKEEVGGSDPVRDHAVVSFSAEEMMSIASLHLRLYSSEDTEELWRTASNKKPSKISYELASQLTVTLGDIPGILNTYHLTLHFISVVCVWNGRLEI